MLTVSAREHFEKRKIRSVLPYFRGSVVLTTLEHIRTHKIKCAVNQLQPVRRC
jgi:hypothetical protein